LIRKINYTRDPFKKWDKNGNLNSPKNYNILNKKITPKPTSKAIINVAMFIQIPEIASDISNIQN